MEEERVSGTLLERVPDTLSPWEISIRFFPGQQQAPVIKATSRGNLMKATNWLFTGGQATGSRSEAIRWWEVRRIPYNLIVGVVGITSIVVMDIIAERILPPGDDLVEPLVLLLGIALFCLTANVVYTFGWILEIHLPNGEPEKHQAYRCKNFKRGLKWSCACATLPIWLSLWAWLLHRAGG